MLLPPMGIDPERVTVVGHSRAAFMANQLLVVNSDIFAGAELFLGGSYAYDKVRLSKKDKDFDASLKEDCKDKCFHNLLQSTIKQTEILSQFEAIANVKNLKNKFVFVYSGDDDQVIKPWNQQLSVDFFRYFGSNVQFMKGRDEMHGLPPNIPKIGYRYLFQNFKGNQKVYSETDNHHEWGDRMFSNFVQFDQQEFVKKEDWEKSMLLKTGWMYYPDSCINAQEKCALQFSLMNDGAKPLEMCNNIVPYAETNNLVVVFPAVKKAAWSVLDKGKETENYLRQDSVQNQFFRAIIERLIKPQDEKYNYDVGYSQRTGFEPGPPYEDTACGTPDGEALGRIDNKPESFFVQEGDKEVRYFDEYEDEDVPITKDQQEVGKLTQQKSDEPKEGQVESVKKDDIAEETQFMEGQNNNDKKKDHSEQQNPDAKKRIYEIRNLLDTKLKNILANTTKNEDVKLVQKQINGENKGNKVDREIFTKGNNSFITKLKVDTDKNGQYSFEFAVAGNLKTK